MGGYTDAGGVEHGFLLSGGQYTTLNVRGGASVEADAINDQGQIVGTFPDASGVYHGFLLSGGQYTTLDDPNAGTGAGQGTLAFGINDSGQIVGPYVDASGVVHGFLATKDDDSAMGAVNAFVAAAGSAGATSPGTLTVSTAGNFVASSGDVLGGMSTSQSPAIVTDPGPFLTRGDGGAAVDPVFGRIDDLFESMWAM